MKGLSRSGNATIALAGWSVAGTSPALAQDGATPFQTKAGIACHGHAAKTPLLPDYPKLAGQNEACLLRQMQDIESGARSNGNTAAMKGVMPIVSDEEMAILADCLSSLK